MPTLDANLRLRSTSDGALTSDETLSVVDLKQTPIRGLALYVRTPAAAETNTSSQAWMDIYIRASSSSDPGTSETIKLSPRISAAGETVHPFVTNKRYIEVFLNINGTGANFSNVQVWLVENVGFPWSRAKSFV